MGRYRLLCLLTLLGSAGLPLQGELYAQQPPSAPDTAEQTLQEIPEDIRENIDPLTFRWIREYVFYIITEEERAVFSSLETSQQRLAFIDQFWQRRDPTPGTPANEFREEHMRRFSYANRHFGAGKPGWKTDRGRIYIMLGPPQSRERNPMGRTSGERASEVWSYNGVKSRSLPASFDLSFVDFNDTEDYQLVANLDLAAPIRSYVGYIGNSLDLISRAAQADSLLDQSVPTYERDKFKFNDLVLDQLNLIRDLQAIDEAAEIQLPEGEIETHVQFYSFPVHISEAHYQSGGGITRSQISFTLDFSPMASKTYQGLHYFHIELLSRLHQGDQTGPVVDEVRDDLAFQVPEEELSDAVKKPLVYQFQHYAPPGKYALELILRDAVSSRLSVTRQELILPALGGEGLGLSTPLLCESIRPVDGPSRLGLFRQGQLELLPRVSGTFRPTETMQVYLQIYGATRDDRGVHDLELSYRIWSKDEGLVLRTPPQASRGLNNDSAIVLYSALPLQRLSSGSYELETIIKDNKSGERINRRVPFSVGAF